MNVNRNHARKAHPYLSSRTITIHGEVCSDATGQGTTDMLPETYKGCRGWAGRGDAETERVDQQREGYYPWSVEQLAIADRCIRYHTDEEKTPFEGYEGLLKYLEPPVADKGEKVTDKPAGETGMGTTPKVEPKLEPMFEVSLPPRPVGAKADCVMLTPRTSRRGRARHRRR